MLPINFVRPFFLSIEHETIKIVLQYSVVNIILILWFCLSSIAYLFFCLTCILCSLTVPSRLALGVEDRRIPDGGFSASSSWNRKHGPKRARLNIPREGRLTGAWCARSNNRAQWLLVDITKPARVVGFGVQGRQDYSQWVTSLKISYSKDGIHFRYYTERRRPKVCLHCCVTMWLLEPGHLTN